MEKEAGLSVESIDSSALSLSICWNSVHSQNCVLVSLKSVSVALYFRSSM